MAQKTRRRVLGFGLEVTAGTAVSVTTALAEHVYDATMVPDPPMPDGPRTPQGHYDGEIDGVPAMRTGTCTFTIQIRPGGQFLPLLLACGYVLNSTTYEPRTQITAVKTATIALWKDGKKMLMHGCCGNCVITLRNGAAATAQFTFRGIWNDPTDAAMPALAPIQAMPYVSNPFVLTMASAAIPLHSEVSIDLGNTVEGREDIGQESGYLHFYVAGRQARMRIDPEAALKAGHDAFGLLFAGTAQAVEGTLTRGDFELVVTAPRAQRLSVGDADRGGKATEPIELSLGNDSGDDWLTFEEVDNS